MSKQNYWNQGSAIIYDMSKMNFYGKLLFNVGAAVSDDDSTTIATNVETNSPAMYSSPMQKLYLSLSI